MKALQGQSQPPRPALQKRLYLAAAAILVVGLASALAVYVRASHREGRDLVREFEDSKRYRHDLEVYGGTMNVLADQFTRWFQGLWHGETLAYTIACITIVLSLGMALVAYLEPSNQVPYPPDKNSQSSPPS